MLRRVRYESDGQDIRSLDSGGENRMCQVSVVIPSYNCASFLPECVDSALKQLINDFEVIIVDDGSTDRTLEVVNQYQDDKRIRLIRQENRGLPAARNAGVSMSRGEYIAALDADDTLEPTALQEMMSAVQNAGASWCIIDIIKFWGGYQEVQKTELPAGKLQLAILREDFIRRAMFLKRSALERIGMWDADIKMREDWDLNIRLINAEEPFVYLPRPLYRYRKRPESITTGDPKPLFTYTEQVLRKHHKRLADAGDKGVARVYAENMWDLARQHFYRRKDLRKAFACIRESLAYDFRPSRILHPVVHKLSIPRVRATT